MRRKPSRQGDRSRECKSVVFIITNRGQRKRDRPTISWQRLPLSCPILSSLAEPELEALLTGTMAHISENHFSIGREHDSLCTFARGEMQDVMMVNAGKHSRGCISGNLHTFGVYLDSKRLDLERWSRVSQKSCSRNSMSLRRFLRVFTLERIYRSSIFHLAAGHSGRFAPTGGRSFHSRPTNLPLTNAALLSVERFWRRFVELGDGNGGAMKKAKSVSSCDKHPVVKQQRRGMVKARGG